MDAQSRKLLLLWGGVSVAVVSAVYALVFAGYTRLLRAHNPFATALRIALSQPVGRDASVSAWLLLVLWLGAGWTTFVQSSQDADTASSGWIRTFWYDGTMSLSLVVLLFVVVKMAMVKQSHAFNPATDWVRPLVRRPVGLLLGIAILNAVFVTSVARGLRRVVIRNKRAFKRLQSRTAVVMFQTHVLVLVVTFAGLVWIVPRPSH